MIILYLIFEVIAYPKECDVYKAVKFKVETMGL